MAASYPLKKGDRILCFAWRGRKLMFKRTRSGRATWHTVKITASTK